MKSIVIFIFSIIPIIHYAQVFDTLILQEQQTVLFDSDVWELSNEASIALDSMILIAKACDTIFLEGHTDKVGSEKYNQILSSKRVTSVKNKLNAIGITEEKIQTKSFGELIPLEKGNEEAAYKYNRRVTLHFLEKQQRRNVTGTVEDKETHKPLLAKIKIEGKNFSDSTTTNQDGKFSLSVPDNAGYKLEVIADNHFFDQRFIKISPNHPGDISIDLPEVKVGSIYTLPNFNFKGDLPVLLPRSEPTLDLLHEMLENSGYCIEIKGHINLPNRPHCELDTRHYKLSVDRAEMVFEHMVKRGIPAKRMLPKGYGNWEMLYPKARIEKIMAKNRRVEIKIIDCDSAELISVHKH